MPTDVAARTHVTSVANGDAAFSLQFELPDARYKPNVAITYSARGGDDVHLGTGFQLTVAAITKNPVPGALDPYFSPDGPIRVVNASGDPDLFAADEDHSGHMRRYVRDGTDWTVTGKTGDVWLYSERVPDGQGRLFPDVAPIMRQENAFGDYIDYDYFDDGRVKQIQYGGNVDGDPAELAVTFEYEPRGCERTDFRTTPTSVHADRLAHVHILVNGIQQRSWDLTYDDCPDRLVGATERMGSTPRSWSFSYLSEPNWWPNWFDPSVFEGPDVGGIPAPRAIEQQDAYAGANSVMGMRRALSLNGDALTDVGDILVRRDVFPDVERDYTEIDQTIDWLGDSTAHDLQALPPLQTFRESETWFDETIPVDRRFVPSRRGQERWLDEKWDSRRALDIDGDGFTDVLDWPTLPDRSHPGDATVRWGGPSGLWSEQPDPISMPPGVPTLSNALKSEFEDCDGHRYCQVLVQDIDLLDWDNDGYVDVVVGNRDEASIDVYRWLPGIKRWSWFPTNYAAPWCDDLEWVGGLGTCALRLSTDFAFGDPHDGSNDGLRATAQLAGMMDLNGDGLLDFVASNDIPNPAVTAGPWTVYLNNGQGFNAPVNWGTSQSPLALMFMEQLPCECIEVLGNPCDCPHVDGDPFTTNRVLTQVGDFNGDHLLDVIDLVTARWYENTGDPDVGFRTRLLPPEWRVTTLNDAFSMTYPIEAEQLVSTYFTRVMSRDWNGDGVLDRVDANTGEAMLSIPTGYLLHSITFETGTTSLSWTTSGEAYPSGVPAMPSAYEGGNLDTSAIAVPTLAGVTEFDPVTGQTVPVSYTWYHPIWDRVRRRFVGYGGRVTEDADHKNTTLWHTAHGYTGLVLDERRTDPNGGSEMVEVQNRHLNLGCGAEVPCLVVPDTQWVRETRGGITKTREVHFDYDRDTANLIGVQNLGEPSRDDDNVAVEVEYTAPGANGLTLPCVVRSGGWLTGISAFDLLVEQRFEFDGLPLCEVDQGARSASEVDRTGEGIASEVLRTEYDSTPYGQVERARAPSGAESFAFFDATFRYVEEAVNPVGHVTRSYVDLWGRLQNTVAPSGVMTALRRDRRGRVVSRYRTPSGGTQDAGDLVEQTTFVDGTAPSITTETLLDGVVDVRTVTYANAWGAAVQTRTELEQDQWLVSDLAYDPTGTEARRNVIHTGTGAAYTGFDANVPATKSEYDAIGHWVRTTDAAGNASTDLPLDPWTDSSKDPERHELHKVKDALGRVRMVYAKRDGAEMAAGTYDYDALGRMLVATDPDGVTTTFEWASTGELLAVTSPDFGTRTYAYDEDGYLVDQYDNAGRHVHYDRDAIGRIVQRSDAGVVVESYDWDTLQPGSLSGVTDAAGSVEYQYDAFARLTQETRTFPDLTTAVHTINEYDDLDRVVSETQPDGVTTRNTYAHGRLVLRAVTLTDGRVLRFWPRYDDRGRFRGLVDGASPFGAWKLGLTLDVDDVDRTTGIHWRLEPKNKPAVVVDHTYGYKLNGLINSRSLSNVSLATTYAYDPAGRIRSATGRGQAGWKLSPGGFPDERTGLEARVFTPEAGPNTHRVAIAALPGALNDPAVLRWRYDYDGAGNVVMIRRIENGRVTEKVEITYDGLGRPTLARSATASMSRSFGHDGTVAYEVVDGKTIKRFAGWESADGKPRTMLSLFGITLGRVEKGKDLVATMVDLHGTPTNEVNEKGAVASTLELDPYGVPIASSGKADVAHQWLGLPRSEKLGLVSTGARLFDERSRMFLSPDPSVLGIKAPRLGLDAYVSNPYAYSRWNGLNLVDPQGTDPLTPAQQAAYRAELEANLTTALTPFAYIPGSPFAMVRDAQIAAWQLGVVSWAEGNLHSFAQDIGAGPDYDAAIVMAGVAPEIAIGEGLAGLSQYMQMGAGARLETAILDAYSENMGTFQKVGCCGKFAVGMQKSLARRGIDSTVMKIEANGPISLDGSLIGAGKFENTHRVLELPGGIIIDNTGAMMSKDAYLKMLQEANPGLTISGPTVLLPPLPPAPK